MKNLPKGSDSALHLLKAANLLGDFYLAGGTSLALQYAHRTSVDLDFFTGKQLELEPLLQALNRTQAFELLETAKGTIHGLLKKVKISFLEYPYPNLKPFQTQYLEGVPLAHPVDIGLMKISAVASRGSRKDFFDLWHICRREISLGILLKLYPKKFGKKLTPTYHILRSLTYFADADSEPELTTAQPYCWDDVKTYFEKEVQRISRKLLKL